MVEVGNRSKSAKTVALGDSEALVAAVPKDAFRAMFHLFAGRPDSKTKVFGKKIKLVVADIHYLHDKILSKFDLHDIDQIVASATLKQKNKEVIQFGTWAEFEGYDWNTSEVTEEISIRWDFLIKVDQYAAAQRHTLTVKIMRAPSTRDMFQAMFALSNDDEEDIENFGSCIARVDFISHRLADELIAIVSEWNRYLSPPEATEKLFSKLDAYDKKIAQVIHVSVPVWVTIISILILGYVSRDLTGLIDTEFFVFGLQWLLVSAIAIYLSSQYSKRLANHCYVSVNEYGFYSPFALTRGDEHEISKLKSKDSKVVRVFFFNAFIAILLNIIAGIATAYLLMDS